MGNNLIHFLIILNTYLHCQFMLSATKVDEKIKVNFLCVYKDHVYDELFRQADLIDQYNEEKIQADANFDHAFQEFILPSETYDFLLTKCEEILKGKRVLKLKAATSKKSGSQLFYFVGINDSQVKLNYGESWNYFLDAFITSEKGFVDLALKGPFKTYAVIKDSILKKNELEIHDIKKLKVIYKKMPKSIEFSVGDKEINSKIMSTEFDAEKSDSIISGHKFTYQTLADFHRMVVKIKNKRKVIYHSTNLKGKNTRSNDYAIKAFDSIENYYLENHGLTEDLKEKISYALHSRTQGFDSPGVNELYTYFSSFGKNLIFGISNNKKAYHKIKLNESFLVMEGYLILSIYAPGYMDDDKIVIGEIKLSRNLIFEMDSGRFGSETFKLEKM